MYTVTEFTPLSAALGGLLIGLAALLMLGFNGRIAGISGIVGNLLITRDRFERAWRGAFVFGLIAGAFIWSQWAPPGTFSVSLQADLPLMLTAGFIVGTPLMNSTQYARNANRKLKKGPASSTAMRLATGL